MINQNIAEKYAMGGPQREPSHKRGPQNEGAPTYVESNINETEYTVRGHSQQVQRNPNAQGQAINSENLINQEYLERNQIQQDAVNVNTNAGTNPEMLGRDTMNNLLYQEARQGRSRQTSVQGSCQRVTTSENLINLNN